MQKQMEIRLRESKRRREEEEIEAYNKRMRNFMSDWEERDRTRWDKRQLEEDMSPFGFIVDGIEDEVIVEKDKNLVWRMVDDESLVERYRDRVTDYDLASIDSTYGLPSSDWEWQ